eukprot:scaffold7838_cov81-Skeletonema_dohrnii-CCMP3373.AAC.1
MVYFSWNHNLCRSGVSCIPESIKAAVKVRRQVRLHPDTDSYFVSQGKGCWSKRTSSTSISFTKSF